MAIRLLLSFLLVPLVPPVLILLSTRGAGRMAPADWLGIVLIYENLSSAWLPPRCSSSACPSSFAVSSLAGPASFHLWREAVSARELRPGSRFVEREIRVWLSSLQSRVSSPAWFSGCCCSVLAVMHQAGGKTDAPAKEETQTDESRECYPSSTLSLCRQTVLRSCRRRL